MVVARVEILSNKTRSSVPRVVAAEDPTVWICSVGLELLSKVLRAEGTSRPHLSPLAEGVAHRLLALMLVALLLEMVALAYLLQSPDQRYREQEVAVVEVTVEFLTLQDLVEPEVVVLVRQHSTLLEPLALSTPAVVAVVADLNRRPEVLVVQVSSL
jgi:hypothetical protein